MKRTFTIVVLALSVTAAKAQIFNTLLATMLQDTLTTYLGQISNIKGMSASVYVPGQGVWTGVGGNSYAADPITADMRFGIASNTKLFTSVMMLKLAEDNILDLDDPLSDHLTITNPNIDQNVTIRELLNHRSGISDPFFVSPWFDTINANPTRVFTPNEVLGWIGAPQFAAGSSYGYSNTNYVLAAMVAQSASGMPPSTLMRNYILTPLDMDSTFIDVAETPAGTIAHRWWNTVDYHDTSRVGLNSAANYAGNIFSTSAEMVQWYHALFSGQIINEASMAELTTFNATSNPNYQYGLGLARETTQGLQYYGHGGSTWGYKSKMLYDPCLDVAVAGLSNSFPSGMDAVAFLLYRVVKNHIPGCSGAISGSTSVCEGTNSVTYTVPPIPNASTYSWSLPSGATGSSTSNSITVNFGIAAVSGTIRVTGLNIYGPGGSSTLDITVNPIPSTPSINQNGNTLTSDASAGNQWYDANGIINGATNPTYTITASGSYYCVVTLQGCSSSASNTINALATDVDGTLSQREMRMYPNPTSAHTTFDTDVLLNNATLIVTDCFGKTVAQLNNLSGQTFMLNRNGMESGLYFVRLIQDAQVISSKKLVITD